MAEFVIAPVGAFQAVIIEQQGGPEGQSRRIESWPVIAFDRHGAPLLMDTKQLTPVSAILNRYENAEWHLDGGAPNVFLEWSDH